LRIELSLSDKISSKVEGCSEWSSEAVDAESGDGQHVPTLPLDSDGHGGTNNHRIVHRQLAHERCSGTQYPLSEHHSVTSSAFVDGNQPALCRGASYQGSVGCHQPENLFGTGGDYDRAATAARRWWGGPGAELAGVGEAETPSVVRRYQANVVAADGWVRNGWGLGSWEDDV